MSSAEVSAGSRRTPAATTAASRRSQHSTMALRGEPRRNASRCASASAVIAAATSSRTSNSAALPTTPTVPVQRGPVVPGIDQDEDGEDGDAAEEQDLQHHHDEAGQLDPADVRSAEGRDGDGWARRDGRGGTATRRSHDGAPSASFTSPAVAIDGEEHRDGRPGKHRDRRCPPFHRRRLVPLPGRSPGAATLSRVW